MNDQFILSCGSTVDMPYAYMQQRNIPVIFYTYMVEDEVCIDNMGRDADALPNFYRLQAEEKKISTSQLNEHDYLEFFEELLQQGDVLHIAFGSGMSASVNNAFSAAKQLGEKYPDRKIRVIDSLCSSSGYGLLVDYAADMRDRGCTMDETAEWVEAHTNKVHHQFFSTDLTHFRRSGRMSGAAASIATILNICPLMHLNHEGKIIAYDKVRGKKNAIRETVRTIEKHIVDGTDYCGKLVISHSACREDAEALKKALVEKFPRIDGEIRIFDIGTIIAAHCGPGTVAAFFLGDERE